MLPIIFPSRADNYLQKILKSLQPIRNKICLYVAVPEESIYSIPQLHDFKHYLVGYKHSPNLSHYRNIAMNAFIDSPSVDSKFVLYIDDDFVFTYPEKFLDVVDLIINRVDDKCGVVELRKGDRELDLMIMAMDGIGQGLLLRASALRRDELLPCKGGSDDTFCVANMYLRGLDIYIATSKYVPVHETHTKWARKEMTYPRGYDELLTEVSGKAVMSCLARMIHEKRLMKVSNNVAEILNHLGVKHVSGGNVKKVGVGVGWRCLHFYLEKENAT